jgi:hypothetical protein
MAKQKENIQTKEHAGTQAKTQDNIQTKNRFEERQPTMDRKLTLSRDKKWLIIKTIRTDIVHVNYLDKVLEKGEGQ